MPLTDVKFHSRLASDGGRLHLFAKRNAGDSQQPSAPAPAPVPAPAPAPASAPTPAPAPRPALAPMGLTPEYMDRVERETQQFQYWGTKSAELANALENLATRLEEGGNRQQITDEAIAKLEEHRKLLQGNEVVRINGPWEVSEEVERQYASIDKQLNGLRKQVEEFSGEVGVKDIEKTRGTFGKWLRKASLDLQHIVDESNAKADARHKETLAQFEAQKRDMLSKIEDIVESTLGKNLLTKAEYEDLMKALKEAGLKNINQWMKTLEDKVVEKTVDLKLTDDRVKQNSQALGQVQLKLDEMRNILDPISLRLEKLLQKPDYDKALVEEILAGINDLKKTQSDPQSALDEIKKKLDDLGTKTVNNADVSKAINDLGRRLTIIKTAQETSTNELAQTLTAIQTAVQAIKNAPPKDYSDALQSISNVVTKLQNDAVGEAEKIQKILDQFAELGTEDETGLSQRLKTIQTLLERLDKRPSATDPGPALEALSKTLEELKAHITSKMTEELEAIEGQHPTEQEWKSLLEAVEKTLQTVKNIDKEVPSDLGDRIVKMQEMIRSHDKLILGEMKLQSYIENIGELIKKIPINDFSSIERDMKRTTEQYLDMKVVNDALIKFNTEERRWRETNAARIERTEQNVEQLINRPSYPTEQGEILKGIQKDIGELKNRPAEKTELLEGISKNVDALAKRPEPNSDTDLLKSIQTDIELIKSRPSDDPEHFTSLQNGVKILVERPDHTDELNKLQENVDDLIQRPAYPTENIEIIKGLQTEISTLREGEDTIQANTEKIANNVQALQDNVVMKSDFDHAIGSLNTKVTNIQGGIKGSELVQLTKQANQGIEESRIAQDQKIADIGAQAGRIEAKMDQIKYDDEGLGGQMKQLREELNTDFQEAIKKIGGEGPADNSALEKKLDDVQAFTKTAVTGVGIVAGISALFGIWNWWQNRSKGENKGKGSKVAKRGHARSWEAESQLHSKWASIFLDFPD
jgi:chromosome segregation ATPase